ncbi:hypothetical protein ABZ816_20245 [Actinosynnema sp. NPDC047251]|uniref:Putative secreted protein n=1 Tax=Saccharothrix espanaensis (strain ATCC 51144 / DSM 44229 / JCM 9112 / NBRC 15066 / NRRL 15764) TaxID=1179773 RepID=K0KDM7_SACES|nr:hypothetical protein [Saccharothrix espanaensis]CCH34894.1 putative secreted protein [Saccharothrix espanaensis DSM 44229]
MRAARGFGNLEDVLQRRALVVRRTDRARGRRRWWWIAPLALVGGLAAVVVSADPVGYGVPLWPFANGSDLVEYRIMDTVTDSARAQGDPARVPSAVTADGVEVLDTRLHPPGGGIWMRVRLHLPDGTRCREVMVLGDGVQVSSRRVDC